MAKKVKCRECGFEAENLEPHITDVHGGLDAYLEKHDVDVSDIISPNLLDSVDDTEKAKLTKDVKEAKKEIVEKTSSSHVELKIAGKVVKFPRFEQSSYTPVVNPAYHFPELFQDVMQDILENKKVMIIGHTGCGKSSGFEQIAAACGQGFLRTNMNGQTTIGDFVGFWTVVGGETVWVDGVLPKAMRDGLWLVVDEIDFAEPAILSVLNAVLEPHGKLCLKEKGHEIIVPHKNFRLFATANAVGALSDFRGLYQGTNIMNEAFLDRWQVYLCGYLPPDAEAEVLVKTFSPRMTLKIASRIVTVANMVRDAFSKEEVGCTFSTRRVLDWTDKMLRHKDPMRAAESTIFSKISPQDAEIVKGIINRVMIGER